MREASRKDASFIYELLNSPTWIQHIGDRGIKDLNSAETYIAKSLLESYKLNGFGMYVMEIKENQKAIGLCGFLKRDQLDHVDIGFAILPAYEGNGYAYEAASTIIEDTNFETIYGITYKQNIGSRRLLEKLGMIHIRNFQFKDYKEQSMLYAMNLLNPTVKS